MRRSPRRNGVGRGTRCSMRAVTGFRSWPASCSVRWRALGREMPPNAWSYRDPARFDLHFSVLREKLSEMNARHPSRPRRRRRAETSSTPQRPGSGCPRFKPSAAREGRKLRGWPVRPVSIRSYQDGEVSKRRVGKPGRQAQEHPQSSLVARVHREGSSRDPGAMVKPAKAGDTRRRDLVLDRTLPSIKARTAVNSSCRR